MTPRNAPQLNEKGSKAQRQRLYALILGLFVFELGLSSYSHACFHSHGHHDSRTIAHGDDACCRNGRATGPSSPRHLFAGEELLCHSCLMCIKAGFRGKTGFSPEVTDAPCAAPPQHPDVPYAVKAVPIPFHRGPPGPA